MVRAILLCASLAFPCFGQLIVPYTDLITPGTYTNYIVTHTSSGSGTVGYNDQTTFGSISVGNNSEVNTTGQIIVDFTPSGITYDGVSGNADIDCSDWPWNGACVGSIGDHSENEDEDGATLTPYTGTFSGNQLTISLTSSAPSAGYYFDDLTVTSSTGGGGGSGSCLTCCNNLETLLTAIEADTASIDSQLGTAVLTLSDIHSQLVLANGKLDNLAGIKSELEFQVGDDAVMTSAGSSFQANTTGYIYDSTSLTLDREAVTPVAPALGNLGPANAGISNNISAGDLTVPLSGFNSTFASVLPSGGFQDFSIDLTPTGGLRDFIGIAILLIGTVFVIGFVWRAVI